MNRYIIEEMSGRLVPHISGYLYHEEDIDQYLQQFITNAKHVLRYGTALEAREYMVNEIIKLEKEFNL